VLKKIFLSIFQFLWKKMIFSSSSSVVDDAMKVLNEADCMGAEQRDAVEVVRQYANKNKSGIKIYIPSMFDMLAKDTLDEEDNQGLLDILNDACTEIESHDLKRDFSGTGAVSFEWIEAPLLNCDAVLVHMEILLDLLIPPKRWIRMSATQLLCTLVHNRRSETETAIERSAAGMEKLVDVLDDVHEEVRNDMLLLLLQLTENNEQLQTFVAFRDVFSKLFQIIETEKEFENDIIVQDCLTIVYNVVKGSMVAQKLFILFIQDYKKHIPKLLQFKVEDGPAKMHTLGQALELFTLTQESDPFLSKEVDVLRAVAPLAFCKSEFDVSNKALSLLGVLCLPGSKALEECMYLQVPYLSYDMFNFTSALVILLLDNDSSPGEHLWDCLMKSPGSQISIVGRTLTPSPNDVSPPAGQLIVDSLLTTRNSKAARLFESMIRGNPTCKELALKINNDSLLSSLMCMIHDESFYRVLIEWLRDSKTVSEQLLSSVSSLLLFEEKSPLACLCLGICLLNNHSMDLLELISNKIGFDVFANQLTKVPKDYIDTATVIQETIISLYGQDNSILSSLYDTPDLQVIECLPFFARHLKWSLNDIKKASQLARNVGKYSVAETLLEMAGNTLEYPFPDDDNGDNENSDEHYQQLLFLLVNQEITKGLLCDKIKQMGGQSELDEVLLDCAKILNLSF